MKKLYFPGPLPHVTWAELGAPFPAVDLTPAKRCSEYHAECADVTNHASCWSGIDANGLQMMKQADGYCPYLVGEVKRVGGTGCG